MTIRQLRHRLLGRVFCRHRNGSGKTWLTWYISKKLELDEQQQQKLVELQDHVRSGREKMWRTWGETRQGITEMLASDTTNSKQLTGFLRDELNNKLYVADVQGNEFITALADFFDTLDAGQRNRLRQHWQRRQGHFGACHHPH